MRKSALTGKFILSAGEIGAYTVCPEAWRLRALEHRDALETQSVEIGKRLHGEWAEGYDESVFLTRRVRLLLILLAIAILLYGLVRT